MERRRARVFKGDWIQLVTTAPPPPPSSESAPPPPPPAAAATSFVLKPPAQHGDPVALAPLADSEFAAVSLVPAAPAAAAEAEAALASSDVVTVQLAGGFLAWWAAPAPIADAAAQPQRQPQPRALLWVDEDEVAEAERASFRPCRFRVESKEEEEGAGSSSSSSAFCVGASLVLVPEAADGGPESDAAAVLCAVASEDPDAPFRLALAPADASSPPAVFTLESVIYSAFPDDDIQTEEEGEDSGPDAPVLVEAPSDTDADAEIGSPSSSVRSTAAARVSEGKELEVVFEEGDLGITIKRTATGQARVLRALPGTQAERNGIRAGDVIRAVGSGGGGDDDYDLRRVVLDSRSWADLVGRIKTAPRPLRVTVLRGGPGAAAVAAEEAGGSVLHALERRLDFSGVTASSSSSTRSPGLLPLDNGKRALLYRGRVSLLQEGRLFGHSVQPRDAYLLSDALLLVVPLPENLPHAPGRPHRATVEAAIGLATCKLRAGQQNGHHHHHQQQQSPGTDFMFEVVTPSGTVRLFAPSAQARGQWVERMYKAIVDVLQLATHTQLRARRASPAPQPSEAQEQQEEGEGEQDAEADALVRHQLIVDTLHSAVVRGNVEEARALLAAAAASSSSPSDGGGDDAAAAATAATAAAAAAAAAAASGLANQQDGAGRTPLHYACLFRRHDLASLLLSRQGGGADPSIADTRGRLPLHLAALALDDVAIALLLSVPASQPLVNARDAEGGRTPAFLAAVHGRLATSAAGGSGDDGAEAAEAEEFALRRCMNALLAHDADILARDHAGRSPLHLVCAALRPHAARAVLDLGADANGCSDDEGLTPLALACRHAATDLAAKRGGAPSSCSSSSLEATLQVLLQGGAQPNLRAGPGGKTAVHVLLENGLLDWPDKVGALGLLVSHGARLDLPAAGPGESGTGAQLLAALLREEGDAGQALRAAADSTLGGAKATWAVKKAGTAGVSSSGGSSGSGSGSGGGGKDGGAVPKLPEAVVSRLLAKAAARPTIRPLSGDAAAGAGGGACVLCGDAFHAITKRPQHCRLCGHQVCGACSSKKLPLAVPGSSGEAARVCDGCFTWGSHQIAAALAAEAERGNKEKEKGGAFSGPEAVARARQRREEARAAQAQQEAAEQKELFGAAAALGEKAMSWLRGGGDGQGDERRQRQQAAARVTGQIEEVRRGLEQRGERIENLADRTEELVNSSAQFAAMARQLKEQNKGWGGLW